uniref:Radial spoke head protein 9 homolog n=1 Tax=Eptatretus burgeri TaxID=7764 RepID=A0A8C4QT30_EPTBU
MSSAVVWACSLNCVDWHLLSPAPESLFESAANLQGRFQGDPSYEYQGEVDDEPKKKWERRDVKIKEEIRLAVVVAIIDEEVAVAPRGAFIKTPTGQVIKNRSFEGICNFTSLGLQFYLVLYNSIISTSLNRELIF